MKIEINIKGTNKEIYKFAKARKTNKSLFKKIEKSLSERLGVNMIITFSQISSSIEIGNKEHLIEIYSESI